MAIRYDTQDTNFRFPNRRTTTQWIRNCVSAEGFRTGDIAVIFCSDDFLRRMNVEYLRHDYSTDIITFDYSDLEKGVVSGDLFISVETVADNASQYGSSAEHEMFRVIIHGILHLCGYGDKTTEESVLMRAKEDFYLKYR